MRMHFPWLYEPQLVDVSDVVAGLEKQYGKAITSAYEGAHVHGVWRAVPQYHGMFVCAYREDLFKKASLKVPDTWEELYTVGKELKKMGNPVGIPISQNYDSISTASPILWTFGGMEVDKDGKTVKINSPATVQTIEWYKKMFKDCMEPEVLSWSDASNNESLQQGKAGWIHNPVSAYIVARNRKLVTVDGINHHRSLAGPAGRHETDVPRSIGIWKFSKNIEASKEWIRYLVGRRCVQPPRLREAAGSPRPPDRPEIRGVEGRWCAVPHLWLARPRVGQGAADHQHVHLAQHDRQGGDGDLDQGLHRLGRERDEEDYCRVAL
jgi:ABC-type glycerol-3-phosphate transport system substrate-binding protein